MLLYAPWPASFASNDNNNNKRCLQTRLSAFSHFRAAMLTRAASSLRSSSRSRCNVAVAALYVTLLLSCVAKAICSASASMHQQRSAARRSER